MSPFISICIPAYKRVKYLDRLLASITKQEFKDFEVIITDDSDDFSVKELVELYKHKFQLVYHKNETALGTPANWNAAISIAQGEWIKLMHDDDWFAEEKSLSIFAENTQKSKKFIFSGYKNIYESSKPPQEIYITSAWQNRIIHEPETVFALNVIGPPSVTMLHKSITMQYDERLKWRVDQEFYIRVLNNIKDYCYIPEALINIGISKTQVTQSSIYNPAVELPEGFIMLQMHGTKPLKNIRVYDAWWRLLRNMKITSEEKLFQYSKDEWPDIIKRIVRDLSKVPDNIVRIGVVSKTLMTLSFLKNRSYID
jgi:glycosyltransferase involved in cell wall biosynthesis